MSIDMRSFSLESNDGIFIGNITLEVKNKDQLEETLKQIKTITKSTFLSILTLINLQYRLL